MRDIRDVEQQDKIVRIFRLTVDASVGDAGSRPARLMSVVAWTPCHVVAHLGQSTTPSLSPGPRFRLIGARCASEPSPPCLALLALGQRESWTVQLDMRSDVYRATTETALSDRSVGCCSSTLSRLTANRRCDSRADAHVVLWLFREPMSQGCLRIIPWSHPGHIFHIVVTSIVITDTVRTLEVSPGLTVAVNSLILMALTGGIDQRHCDLRSHERTRIAA